MYDDVISHFMGSMEDKIPKTYDFSLSLMAIKMQQQTKIVSSDATQRKPLLKLPN